MGRFTFCVANVNPNTTGLGQNIDVTKIGDVRKT